MEIKNSANMTGYQLLNMGAHSISVMSSGTRGTDHILHNGKILACIHDNFDEEEHISSLYDLPDDVKEGHFVVHAVDDGELRRFVVELSYLAHPGFLKLLQQAEEEFGFRQKGILAVPCGYSDLQRLLESKEEKKV